MDEAIVVDILKTHLDDFLLFKEDGFVKSPKNVIASEAKQSLVLYLIVFIGLLRRSAPRNDTINDFLRDHQRSNPKLSWID